MAAVGVDRVPGALAGTAPALEAARVERLLEDPAAVQRVADRAGAVVARVLPPAVAAAVAVRLGGDPVRRGDHVLDLLRSVVRGDGGAAVGGEARLAGRVAPRRRRRAGVGPAGLGPTLLGPILVVRGLACRRRLGGAAQQALVGGSGAAVDAQALLALEGAHLGGGAAAVLAVPRGREADPREVGLELLDVAAGRAHLQRASGVARLGGGGGECDHEQRGEREYAPPKPLSSHVLVLSSFALPELADGLARKESRYAFEKAIRPYRLVPPADQPPERAERFS